MKPIIFIGMAGVGKTTFAKAIAKQFGYSFIDTDQEMMHDFNCSLDSLIANIGSDKFIQTESEYVKKNCRPNSILAPGGSFIYSTSLIKSIKSDVVLIYLFDTAENILKRIPNLQTRGIIGLENTTFESLWQERHKQYSTGCHVQFNINHHGFDKTEANIKEFIESIKSL